jgi:hypothetical protein
LRGPELLQFQRQQIQSPSNKESPFCHISVPGQNSDWQLIETRSNDVSLYEWLQSRMRKMPNYAVCLRQLPIATHGILFKDVRTDVLVKAGKYWHVIDAVDDIQRRSVNWTLQYNSAINRSLGPGSA